jgi:hypothetical protein
MPCIVYDRVRFVPSWRVTFADIQPWQTLIGSSVALVAIVVAYLNTSRTLAKTERLEQHRRERKQIALRALLPLALSEICKYAEKTAEGLVDLYRACANGVLVHTGISAPTFPSMPGDVIKSLSEFIEYSDEIDVQILVDAVRKLQIVQARINGLSSKLKDASDVSSQHWIETLIIDCSILYARTAAAFDFSRGEKSELPREIGWDNVRSSLKNMSLWDFEFPSIHAHVTLLENAGSNPK